MKWATPKGFSRYEVSEYGDIKSLVCSIGVRKIPRPHKSWLNGGGYLYTRLVNDEGKPVYRHVHRLVLLAFLGLPIQGNMDGSHLDGSKTNNHISNLRWETRSQNHTRKRLHGTSLRGESNHQAKLTEAQAKEIFSLKGAVSSNRLAEKYGISRTAIKLLWQGKSWSYLHA